MGMLELLVLIVILLLVLGAAPAWPHSRNWGYGPSGGLLAVLDHRAAVARPLLRVWEWAAIAGSPSHGWDGGAANGSRGFTLVALHECRSVGTSGQDGHSARVSRPYGTREMTLYGRVPSSELLGYFRLPLRGRKRGGMSTLDSVAISL